MKWKFTKDRLSYLPHRKVPLLIIALSALLVGCNTMEGVGTDVKQAGSSLERAAERNKSDCAPCPYPCRH